MNLKRTHYCGEVAGIGNQVVAVGGFVKRIRDKGGIMFIDLRDRTGVVQLVLDDTVPADLFDIAKTIRSEYVIMARGLLRERESVNQDMATGSVEVLVSELHILSQAQTPPFEITDKTNVSEELRLKYRYLDLRRKELQDNLIMRHKIAAATREYFYENGFIEIETPTFMKSTPEGARDYLVPSRIHNGKFYALPQSPQIYKQLLMVAGFDRYIQLARCYRDEDLRADRQPEFTQIDLEMSFVDVPDVLEMLEGFIKHVMAKIKGVDIALPLPRLTFNEAMAQYGSDKPDTRYDMEIVDLSEVIASDELRAFANAGIVAKGAAAALTRKEIDKLSELSKGIGGKSLAFIRWVEDAPSCSFGKFLGEGELLRICEVMGCEKGDVALITDSRTILGAVRTHVAEKLNMIDKSKFNFVWITDMPFFHQNDDGNWEAMHHPFTCPTDESMQYIETVKAAGSACPAEGKGQSPSCPELKDKGKVYAKAYDLVINGVELMSGSIRINDYELQSKMFAALGLTDDEIDEKFGFLVEAYKYAAPPHGGAGFGLDRLAMVLCGADNLRDVTAFPKVKDASEPMSACPAEVSAEQLAELGIVVKSEVK
ncbi:MAG: aspartate--tRNA ligase [Oscillospiraceae bacterium]|nr:aspartate--tRNA ligase [Oscillospiraceae bacterium]